MSNRTQERFNWASVWSVLVVIATLAIFTTAMDSSGRQKYEHAGPIPAGIEQLSPSAYLLPVGALPEKFCGGGTGGHSVSYQKNFTGKARDFTYVQCEEEQRWNVSEPGSPNWGHSFLRVSTSFPAWLVIAPIVALLYGLMWYPMYRRDRRKVKAEKRQAAEYQKQAVIDAEVKRKELTRAYATGEIDDIQYESGLNRIYQIMERKR